jgi:light-regulated signal transduction histidine kinase (bacteriophytochrome)
MKVLEYLNKLPKTLITVSGLVFTVALGIIDYLTGPDISFLIVYLLPVSFVTWFVGIRAGIFIFIVGAAEWVYEDVIVGHSHPHFIIPYWNVFMKFGIFLLIIYILSALKKVLESEKDSNKKLEQSINELNELNREMEAFGYSVSHDLRTPLVVIGLSCNRLLKKYSDRFDEKGREELKIIRESTKKMDNIIDGLLALSRLGRRQIKFENIDMNNLVKDIIDELKPFTSEGTSIDIKDLAPAKGDQLMLHQVLYNLLSNAIKFTKSKEAAVIEVGCKSEIDEYIYYIKDNGAGFDIQYADKLFHVFQRLHKAEEFEGTGIGLAIVQRIINRHGGRVWAEGKVNEGATFYFSLPKMINVVM